MSSPKDTDQRYLQEIQSKSKMQTEKIGRKERRSTKNQDQIDTQIFSKINVFVMNHKHILTKNGKRYKQAKVKTHKTVYCVCSIRNMEWI